MKTSLQTADAGFAFRCNFYLLDGFGYYRCNDGYIFLKVALRYLEQAAFGILQQVVDVV